MNGQQAAETVRRERFYLQNIIKDFKPEHENYGPVDGMLTVAQQIMHIATTVDWFRQGAFGTGFDMDFENGEARNHEPATLANAMAVLDREYTAYQSFLAPLSETDLLAPMNPNAIFGEAPRLVALYAQMDHTAHHRGSLAVYLRLLGVTPAMVYAE